MSAPPNSILLPATPVELSQEINIVMKVPPPLPGLGTGYQLKKMVGGVTPPKYPKKKWKKTDQIKQTE